MRVVIEILHFVFWSIFWGKRQKKLTMVNAFPVLWDGSMDKSVMEKYVYVAFADPETGKPTLVFFEVVAPSKSQNAPGLKKATINTFQRNYFESVIEIVFFRQTVLQWIAENILSWSNYFKLITLGYNLSGVSALGLSWH